MKIDNALYQKKSGLPRKAPQCPDCGSSHWIASRPHRLKSERHPQDKPGWVNRAIKVFTTGLLFMLFLSGFAFMCSDMLPTWVIWIVGCSAISVMMTTIIIIDGIAVESKSCFLYCKICENCFIAPWKPLQ